jgi:hypothetical protein
MIASCEFLPRLQVSTEIAGHYGLTSDATPESYKFTTLSRILSTRELSRNYAGHNVWHRYFLLVTSIPLAARTRKLLHSRHLSLAPLHLACNLRAGGWREDLTAVVAESAFGLTISGPTATWSKIPTSAMADEWVNLLNMEKTDDHRPFAWNAATGDGPAWRTSGVGSELSRMQALNNLRI